MSEAMMMKRAILKVDNGDALASARAFLRRLLESGVVDTVLVPRMLPSEDGFVQTLVKDPAMLETSHPLAPTMAVQSARVVSELCSRPLAGRVGVVLKPCELRAVVELMKFLQVDAASLVTIGVDCAGTYEVRDYALMARDDKSVLSRVFTSGAGNGSAAAGNGYAFRDSCRICENPVPSGADITLGFIGHDPSKELVIEAGDELAGELAEKASLSFEDGAPQGREQAASEIIGKRRQERARVLGELAQRTKPVEKLMETLSTCIRCHNCMNACPICYCKQCVFRSPLMEHRPEQLVGLAGRKGAVRLPADTLMFHLTRLSHMGTSCVGCGMCESACPNRLPVAQLFSLIGGKLQDMFDYVPGRDAGEEPPVSMFKEHELHDETGSGE